jgi:phosphonate transport system permease protein
MTPRIDLTETSGGLQNREILLRSQMPRSRFLRVSGWILFALTCIAWFGGTIEVGDLFSSHRSQNLERFITQEITPWPWRHPETNQSFSAWLLPIWQERAADATATTLWIAILAASLAGAIGLLAAPLSARNLMRKDPLRSAFPESKRIQLSWLGAICQSVRILQALLRAIPEYIWAFLLLALLGTGAWPAVLALAIHNAGILGRLGGDTVENLSRPTWRGTLQLGANRRQFAISTAFAEGLPRYLLYLFYRWETCIREATVLGMLGIATLGYWIDDARVRQRYDEMIVLILCGGALVLAGDFLSYLARRWIRQ